MPKLINKLFKLPTKPEIETGLISFRKRGITDEFIPTIMPLANLKNTASQKFGNKKLIITISPAISLAIINFLLPN